MAAENPVDLPNDHPLADYNGTLDDHESHLEAISQYLDTHTNEIESVFLVINTETSSDTIPTMRDGIDFENHVWMQLAAHISHVANAFQIWPEHAARHACHVLADQVSDPDLYQRDHTTEDDS